MWQNILMQKNLKIHRVDPEENATQTDRQMTYGQTYGQMNRTDFIGLLHPLIGFSCFSEIRK